MTLKVPKGALKVIKNLRVGLRVSKGALKVPKGGLMVIKNSKVGLRTPGVL